MDFTQWEPLIPKLRGLFAEFLNEGSLERLGTFIPVYQCRFAVRSPLSHSNEAFLDGIGSMESPRYTLEFPAPSAVTPEWICLLRQAYREGRTMSNRRAPPTFPCPPFALNEILVV